MKKFLILLSMLFCFTAYAQTETLNWYMDGNIYTTTTCESGNDILLPTTPTKRGYTFKGWASSYIPIEYLESTGTQYIDTGVMLYNNYVRIELTNLVYTDFPSDLACYVFCGSTDILQKKSKNSIHICPGSQYIQINVGDIVNRQLFATSPGIIYNISYEYDNMYYTVIVNDMMTTGTYSGTVKNTEASIYLYSFHEAGKTTHLSKIKLSGCKIYADNDVLVRDFIPVLDKDGTPCMYDKVEKKFYYNAGTGQFIAGPIIGAEQ